MPEAVVCPEPVSGVSAEGGPNLAAVSWTANDDGAAPEGFYVEVTGPEGFAKTVAVPAPATGTEVAGLKNGIEYSFRVTAATRDGSAAASGWVTATPSTGMEGVVAGVIVEFEPGSQKVKGETAVPGEDRVEGVDLVVGEKVADDAVLVELSEPVDVDTATRIADDLEADPEISWAEPDQFFFTSNVTAADSVQGPGLAQPVTVPSDSDYATSQWNLWDTYGVSVGDGAEAMTDAWAGATGDGVNVAVIDTGITPHPDLDGQLVDGYDFVSNPEKLSAVRQANAPPVAFDGDYIDEATYGALGRDANPTDPGDWRGITPTRNSSWHGTQKAGIIAAANNADGITGIAPNARIQPIRALSWRGGLLSDIAASITWASGGTIDGVPANENPSTVINMSFAVETICPTALQDAIDGARDRGAILVAAAGNASDDASKFAPGNCEGVITVAASNRDGQRADYSNYGPTIDISAPGGDSSSPIATTSNTGTQTPDQPATGSDFGTSAAAAHVSAAAAILASRNASLTPDQAYEQLTGNAFTKAFAGDTCDAANPDYSCGTGILSLAQIQTVASGDQDYAMTFNGTSQYATALDDAAFDLASAFTVEVWVKPATNCPSGVQAIAHKSFSYFIYCDSGTWQFQFVGASDNTGRDTGVSVLPNVWQHLSFARDADDNPIEFFFNGQLAYESPAATGAIDDTDANFSIGVQSDSGVQQRYFDGEIDEVRIYTTDRSNVDGQNLIPTDMHTYGPTDTTGLVAYYDFNEGPAGTTGTGTVYNRADTADSTTNLRTVNGPTYTDVKQTTSNGNNTVVTFPRSYLTAAGGWRVPEGVSSVEALIVAGGGGGGSSLDTAGAGGGGAGGLVLRSSSTGAGQLALTPGTAATVQVGAGGLGAVATERTYESANKSGSDGQASQLAQVTATGGGGGGGREFAGRDGGSGGGAGGRLTRSGGAGTTGQGNSGGNSTGGDAAATWQGGAGGGGAGGPGVTGTAVGPSGEGAGGPGGAGLDVGITGTTITYSKGGDGGTGRAASAADGAIGTASSGDGGGGASVGSDNFASGGDGGSGVVIVSYSTANTSCEPFEFSYIEDDTVYRVLKWSDPTQTGCTWTPPAGVTSADVLLVGGGGGGGSNNGTYRGAGGGGAGGFRQFTQDVSTGSPFLLTVGAGGAAGSVGLGQSGSNGGATTAFGVTAVGGGGGGAGASSADTRGKTGGSGGGGGNHAGTFGSGTSGQGSNGGIGSSDFANGGAGGGGGGASQPGEAAQGTTGTGDGGDGGDGQASGITGISVTYAGGGGGGGGGESTGLPGSGGQGGGGTGSTGNGNGAGANATSGVDGLGGGGGGASRGTSGGDGGDGVIIVRYAITQSDACVPFEYPSGNFTVVEFQGAGTCDWTVPSGVTAVDVLAVGGGGGGGGGSQSSDQSTANSGGGGGGGQVQFVSDLSVSGTVGVTVGAGGSGGAAATTGSFNAGAGSAGESSEFDSTVALGGEGGGIGTSGTSWEVQAGDGGGSSRTIDGTLTSTRGGTSDWDSAGGGAGAGADGSNGRDISGLGGEGGDGGLGYRSSITGASVIYGGGGGGGGTWDGTGSARSDGSGGAGGDGGGGAGSQLPGSAASQGTDGLGGGGGGAGRTNGTASVVGADGGDGVVIVRYETNWLSLSAGDAQQPSDYTYSPAAADWDSAAPKVQLISAAGTALSTSGVSVTASFTASSGSATLSGATVTTDANGVADFSSLVLNGDAGTSGTLTFSATGYGSVTSSTVTIGKAPLTVTADDQSVSYGTAVSTVTGAGSVTYSGFVNSETSTVVSGTVSTYSTTYTATTDAGTSGLTITPVVSGLSATNYSFSAANGTVTVTKANQAALSLTSTSGTYGTDITLTTSGGTTGGSVLYTVVGGSATGCSETGGALTSTSAGTCTVTATMLGNTNYNDVSSSPTTVTFGTVAISLTADNATKVFGAADPTFSSSVSAGALVSPDAVTSVTYTFAGTGSTSYGPSTTPPSAVGTYSITPSAVVISPGGASSYDITYVAGAYSITSAAATKLVITGSSSQTAGASQDLTITAYDVGGNVATTYTGEKSLTFSGATQAPAGQMPAVKNKAGATVVFGTATTIEFVNGEATVSAGNNGAMTLYAAEAATISVTDGSISSSGSDRLTVTVTEASAASLNITTEPVGGAPGGVLATQPVVTIIDAYGNTVTSSSASVVASIASGTNGTLGGATTVSASSGVVTFTDLTLDGDQGATYTLSFTSGILASATSASLDVDLYEDSTTDGGGWKLVAYGDGAILGGYLNAPSGRYDPTTRTGKATFDATSFFNEASEVAISWNQSGFATGGINSYDYAVKWTLPTPADMTLTGDSGTCTRGGNACPAGYFTPVTITDIQGTTGLSTTQYMRAATFGVNYSSSYGLVSVQENWGPDSQNLQAIYLGKPGGSSAYGTGYVTTDGTTTGFQPSTAAIWVRTLTANKLAIDTNAAGAASGAAFTTQPAVAIQSSSNGLVTSDNSTVITASVSGSAELVGTTTATASNGVATFSDLGVSATAGTYTLTFSSGSLTVATQAITVTAGAAVTIAVNAGGSQTATAGSAVGTAPSVLVTDAQGNPVQGTSVTFAVASGGGSLASSGAVTTDASGIATSPTWTLGTTAGSNTLTATSSGLSGSPVTFTATGTVGSASLLSVVTGAGGAASGAAFTTQPAVEITDANGNLVISDSSTVVSVDVSVGGTLVGTTTATASNGLATFLNLGISGLAGNYTLTFSATGLTDATDAVTLAIGAATALTITAAAGDTTYGTDFSPQPEITVVDSGGNTVTSWSISVTATVKDSGGSTLETATATPSSGVATFTGLGSDVGAGTQTVEYTSGALTMADETVVVAQKPVTITASSPSVTYGDPIPSITPSYSGFVNGQDATVLTTNPTCTTTYSTTSNAGTSPSTSCSGAAADNYTFAYTPGSVTIGKATPTLGTWADVDKTYGDGQFALTAASVAGVTGASLAGAFSYSSADTSVAGVVGTTVTVAGAGTSVFTATFTPTDTTNYNATSTTMTLTVDPAPLTITASSASVTYGDAVPTITPDYSGFVNGQSPANLTTQATCSTTYTTTSAVGSYASTCSGASSSNYSITYVAGSITVNAKAPSLSWSGITKTYGNAPFTLTAPTATGVGGASVAGTFAYTSSSSTVASVSGDVVTIVGAGSATLTATFTPTSSNYSSGQTVTSTLTVNKANQATLTMTSPSTAIFGETITLAASGGSGTGALSFGIVAGTCTITGTNTLVLGDANSMCEVAATKQTDANYNLATSATQTITITEAGQTLAFTSTVPTEPLPNGTYTPLAEAVSTVTGASSGVTPTFSASGVCTEAGGEVTFTATGTCTVTASAAAVTNRFTAASPVSQVIVVGSLNQTITFAQPANKAFGSSSFALGATASSGETVTYALGANTTNSACSVSSLGVVTILAVGTCEVTASAASNAQYAAASDVTRAFQVVPALPTAPTLTSASASSQAITVGVVAPGFTGGVSISAYEVVATPVTVGTAPVVSSTSCTSSPCTIGGLVNGVAYTVKVAAINAAGTGPYSGSTGSLTPATAAFAVGALSAAPGDEFVDVSWTQPTDLGGGDFVRYDLYYKPATSPTYGSAIPINPTTPSDITTAATSYRVGTPNTPALDNGTSYDFKVITITEANGVEIPGGATEVVQYPSDEPSEPQSPVVLAATATDVQFSWSAPLSDGGSALTNPNYTVTVTGPSVASNACDPGPTGTSCTVGGLVNGSSYTFAVVANNRMGSSAAATVIYNVPSSVATLSDLVVWGTGGSVSLTPSFDPSTTAYNASVTNGVTAVTVTPTTTAAGATVTVDGVSVTSGTVSSSISLSVGSNVIDVEVTASDPRFTETYTLTITRAAAVVPPSPDDRGGSSPGVPVTPPTPVMEGEELGAVTVDGVVESGVVLVRAPNEAGWEAVGTDFQMMVITETSSGAPEPLAPSGVMQVPQGGRIVVSGDGYMASSSVSVFAIPRVTTRSAGSLMQRSISGAMFVGSAQVSASGTVSATFTVPTGMNLGDYVLQINGETAAAQVRSVNLLMNVIAAQPSMKAGIVQRAGFYVGLSDEISPTGERKLRQIVRSVPKDAQAVQVLVTGVSVGLDSLRANAILAADRAATLAQELEDRGIDGEYVVTVTTSYTVDGAERSLDGKADVLTTQTGKPLSTVTILFQEPV